MFKYYFLPEHFFFKGPYSRVIMYNIVENDKFAFVNFFPF